MPSVIGDVSTGIGVTGKANSGIGVNGVSNDGNGVRGTSWGSWKSWDEYLTAGVAGFSAHGHGVYGLGIDPDRGGVRGESRSGPGVSGAGLIGVQGDGSVGVAGQGSWAGVTGDAYGHDRYGGYFSNFTPGRSRYEPPSFGPAGRFLGNVEVAGSLSKSGGGFKIDHPLDPGGKYLSHSFVESSDMKNIYDGIARLDRKGEAVVKVAAWCEALNEDFRYQLTAIGAAAPGLYVAQEVRRGRFKIAGGKPGMKVSWQLTGIRKDAWANAHRIPVEERKSRKERGHYLHPELLRKPIERSIDWARHPELTKARKKAEKRRARTRRPA
jgi:hypothetical protein